MAHSQGQEALDIGQQLQYKDQSELLDAIDELSQRGLRNYVSLPQIIVCGDQSSGKSSVLDAISHVRFPAIDNLCTTFATELLVRRTPTTGAPVCIIPGPSRDNNAQAKAKLEQFPGDRSCQGPEDIPPLIDLAKQAMKDASGTSANPFFDDKLRIQLCKPEWPPITIVDLPGLIQNENSDQTRDDVKNVRGLVKQYMENPRSIILAIVSAQSDVALQGVLSLAKEVDPDKKRTMGIITKPDMLEHRGPESMKNFRTLALNESEIHQFKLGWHVLKNRDPRSLEQSAAERDASEASFFLQTPWASFEDQTCLGIDSLRIRLSRVLHERIASSLPDIIEEIREETSKCEGELLKLGKQRTKKNEKEVYLLGIAQRFQSLAQSAVDGTWSDQFDPFFKNPYSDEGYDKRLRAVVQNLNDQFANLMETKGRKWNICSNEKYSGLPLAQNEHEASANYMAIDRKYFDITSRRLKAYPDSDRFEPSKKITHQGFIHKIESLSMATRGRELSGVFNHHTIGELFREQSTKWAEIAEHHVYTVWSAVRLFLEEAFSALADSKTVNAIFLDIVDPMMAGKFEQAKVKLHEILVPHTKFHPISYNNKLVKSMNEAKYKRELERVKKEAMSLIDAQKSRKLTEEELESLVSNSSASASTNMGEKFGCSDILDYMNAYYEISLNTFVDNVATLVIESCLVNDLANIFPATTIPDMDEYTLDRLASDSEDVIVRRKKLESKLTCFKESLKICQKNLIHIPRDFRRSEKGKAKAHYAPDAQEIVSSLSTHSPVFRTAAPIAPASSKKPTSGGTSVFEGVETSSNTVSNSSPRGIFGHLKTNGAATEGEPGASSPSSSGLFFGQPRTADAATGVSFGGFGNVASSETKSSGPFGQLKFPEFFPPTPPRIFSSNSETKKTGSGWSPNAFGAGFTDPITTVVDRLDPKHKESFHSIVYHDNFKKQSPEEHRLADYNLYGVRYRSDAERS